MVDLVDSGRGEYLRKGEIDWLKYLQRRGPDFPGKRLMPGLALGSNRMASPAGCNALSSDVDTNHLDSAGGGGKA